MGLIDRLQSEGTGAPSAAGPSLFALDTRQLMASSNEDVGKERFQALKGRIQDLLLKKIDVTKLEDAGYAPLLSQVNAVIDDLVEQDHLLLADERLLAPLRQGGDGERGQRDGSTGAPFVPGFDLIGDKSRTGLEPRMSAITAKCRAPFKMVLDCTAMTSP